MKNIFFVLAAGILLSCGNGTSSDNKDDTANIHTLDTTTSDSAGIKKDHTENRQNEDSLPPIQH